MADSSIVTLGAARSLLVDSLVYDSRIGETTKDHIFLDMDGEDGEGQYAGGQPLPPLYKVQIIGRPHGIPVVCVIKCAL